MHLGGARVSTDAQDRTNQCTELAAAGCTKLFSEKLSGAQRDRQELGRMLDRHPRWRRWDWHALTAIYSPLPNLAKP